MIQFDPTLATLIAFYVSPVMVGILICMALFIVVAYLLEKFPKSKMSVVFDMFYEKVYAFYSDILGDDASSRIKIYIATLFFVIFFANIAGVVLDFIAPMFGVAGNGDFHLAQYIVMPTSDIQFNVALALFSTLLLLYVQFGSLGVKNFFYNYLPVWGKGYIEVERGKLSATIYYPLALIAKVADIVISLFLGFLDIIGLFAKVISLSFRLFGNMTSGTILLGMLIVGISSFSNELTQFIGGVNFPIIAPLLVYAQGLLVAVIQAMVFPLLVAIFIRMAMMEAK